METGTALPPSPFDLNLRHLAAAAVAARRGSLTAAATEMNMSQSALTQAIARLEAQLGEALFDRVPSGVTATPPALKFFARAERAIALLAEGLQAARDLNNESRCTMSQLRALIAVEQARSYTLAASATGYAQPTLHRTLHQFEQMLGTRLFTVTGKSLRPTPRAEQLCRRARLAVVELQAGLDEISALRNASAGRVIIGSLPLARSVLLPKALAAFSQANPSAILQVADGSYEAMLYDLRRGEIDLLLGALRTPVPFRDLLQIPLFFAGLVVVARATHPLAEMPHISLEEMRCFPWIAGRKGAPGRIRWEKLFEDENQPLPERVVETGSIVVVRGLLLEDDFLTLLSPDQFRLGAERGLLTQIGAPVRHSTREIGITCRTGWRPTALQARFLQTLHELTADGTAAAPAAFTQLIDHEGT